MNTVSAFYQRVAHEFAKRVVRELGDEIQAIVLYGSVARREARRDSDIDVLVVTRNRAAVRWPIARMEVEQAARYDYEPWVTCVYLSPEEVRRQGLTGFPFVRNVLQDGVILYDDGTFAELRDEILTSGRRDVGRRAADA